MRFDTAKFIECIEEAGYEARSYSGRCMYGRRCVGVDIDRGDSEFVLGVKLCHAANEILGEDDAPDFIEELTRQRTRGDSMGMGSIVYWPDVEWVDSDDEDEDCEDDCDEPGHAQANEP